MTLKEQPVTYEKVARYLTTIPNDIFFDDPRNQDFITGRTLIAFVSNPIWIKRISAVVTFLLYTVVFGILTWFLWGVVTLFPPLFALWVTLFHTLPLYFTYVFTAGAKWGHGGWLGMRYRWEGQLLRGEIVRAEGTFGRGSHQPLTVYIEYKFTRPQGSALYKKISELRPDYRSRLLPTGGTPVYVLYFHDKEYYLL